MSDPRILIVTRSHKRPGSTWFGTSFADAKSGRELDAFDLRSANVIAEVRPAGFYFIWKDRGGRSGRLRFGVPKLKRMTPIECLSTSFAIAGAAIGRFAFPFDLNLIDDPLAEQEVPT